VIAAARLLVLGSLVQAPALPAPVVPVPTAPAPPASAATSTVGDVWLVIYSVLPDRTAEFEGVAKQVREALGKSPQEIRQAQAREMRIHRSALPNADGKVMYFLQIPALTGDADRSGFDVLIDAVLPAQATTLKKQLTSTLDPANPSGNTYLVNVR
jgi:hypothetical protein